MPRILCSSLFFFACAALARSQSELTSSDLLKDKTQLLVAADRLNLTDFKICYELGLLTERAYAFVEKSRHDSELSFREALRIKLTKQVSELEGFCNHNLDDHALNEGDRPELFKRLGQINTLRQQLDKANPNN